MGRAELGMNSVKEQELDRVEKRIARAFSRIEQNRRLHGNVDEREVAQRLTKVREKLTATYEITL